MFCIILRVAATLLTVAWNRPVSVTFFAASRRSILFRREAAFFARTSWFGGEVATSDAGLADDSMCRKDFSGRVLPALWKGRLTCSIDVISSGTAFIPALVKVVGNSSPKEIFVVWQLETPDK